jgi:hypothetical protein
MLAGNAQVAMRTSLACDDWKIHSEVCHERRSLNFGHFLLRRAFRDWKRSRYQIRYMNADFNAWLGTGKQVKRTNATQKSPFERASTVDLVIIIAGQV